MKISIFGLGYVGCVGAACLAKLGHHVIGNDVSENKVNLINQGKPTIIEADIDELIKEGHDKGLIEATMDYHYAVHNSEISFIVVGTPSSKEGHLNLNYIYGVARQIGEAMKDKHEFHIVAIRSTVLPGTNQKVGEIIAEASGKERGKDFTVVSNPEFLREGTAVKDYMEPPLTLIGTDSEVAEQKFRELYKDIPGEFISTEIKVAEMMKYSLLRSRDNEVLIGVDHAALGFGSIAAHGHADALSFQLFYQGKPVFVDPGTYIYHCDLESRNEFRRTRNHNTVCIDGNNQSEMPIFFMSAGYCFSYKYTDSFTSVSILIKKRLKSLWLPYAIVNTIFILLNNTFLQIGFYSTDERLLALLAISRWNKQVHRSFCICKKFDEFEEPRI